MDLAESLFRELMEGHCVGRAHVAVQEVEILDSLCRCLLLVVAENIDCFVYVELVEGS